MLDLNLRVAFCREICLLLGLCDVDRPTLLARLQHRPGSAVFLAVGGAAESLLTQVDAGSCIFGPRVRVTPNPSQLKSRRTFTVPSQRCSFPRNAPLLQPGCLDLILLRRKGFVRLALEAGADLVPVLAFGENECYKRGQLVPGSMADRMQRATKKVGQRQAAHVLDKRCGWHFVLRPGLRPPCCRCVGSTCRAATAGAS